MHVVWTRLIKPTIFFEGNEMDIQEIAKNRTNGLLYFDNIANWDCGIRQNCQISIL